MKRSSLFAVLLSATTIAAPAGMTSEYASLVEQLRGKSGSDRKEYMDSAHPERAYPLFQLKGADHSVLHTTAWLEVWDQAVLDGLKKAGMEITLHNEARLLVEGWVPLDQVEAVASVAGVRTLRRPSYGIPSSGTIDTQGNSALGTSLLRILGSVDGNGISVGVISRGLFRTSGAFGVPPDANADARVVEEELPANSLNPAPLSGFLGAVEIRPSSLDSHAFGEPEGAAILEILHDLAPKAGLFYGSVTTELELSDRRNFLRLRGVDVIVDNMLFFDAGRFDGSSFISREAQRLTLQNDIVYVSSVGNYTPPPATVATTSNPLEASATNFPLYINGYLSPVAGFNQALLHNWASDRISSTSDNYLTMSTQGGVIDVVLVWDDVWSDTNPAATDDLDLYLNQINGAQIGSVVASSIDPQNNSGRPIERITVRPGFQGTYGLSIRRKNTSDASRRLFSVMILQGTVSGEDVKYLTHSVPMVNGDLLPPAITVGAIDTQQGFDQLARTTVPGLAPGPGRQISNSFVRWYESQIAPSVVSLSNVATASMGDFGQDGVLRAGNLTGSSAAAAHIGGIVALLRHSRRDIPAWRYHEVLRDRTLRPEAGLIPTAVQINPETEAFGNGPIYLRPGALDAWFNFTAPEGSGSDRRSVPLIADASVDENGWEHSDKVSQYAEPVFGNENGALTITPDGQENVFGFWQTDLFEFLQPDGSSSHELRADRLYEVTVRVGSDESEPTAVPDFRLRLITGGSDESVSLTVAGIHSDASIAPTTIGGKEYKLYYRPTNNVVAKQGVRFAFDLLHFELTDNAKTVFTIHDVVCRELNLPTP